MTLQERARACAEQMWAGDAASQGMGMALESVAPGAARLSMEVAARMVNGHGICHGGYLFALADSAFAFACNTTGEVAVAQHGAVTFVRPARLGERLVADAREQHRAQRSGTYDVRVETADGELVALFRGDCRTTGARFEGVPA
jgi:acyl-CoA thioesterase